MTAAAAVRDALVLDPLKNCVEVIIAYLEGIVMGLECMRVEVEDKRVVTRTGAKCERDASYCSPKMRAKNLTDAWLYYTGTIVWSSTIGMVMSPDAPIPTLMAPGVCAARQASEHLSRLSGRRHKSANAKACRVRILRYQ